jgi:saccharopepsin
LSHIKAPERQPPTPIMLSKLSILFLVPFVAAKGVHRLKLSKVPQSVADPSLEGQYLAQKYGAQSLNQMPLMGAGGAGRRFPRPGQKDDLYWTQEIINGGHGVPLSSTFTSM